MNTKDIEMARLRSIYTGKAIKHMSVQDMHRELRELTVPMVLCQSQIEDIVNCAYHAWNNPNKHWAKIQHVFFDGWVVDKGA
jgi:hypothetical protein